MSIPLLVLSEVVGFVGIRVEVDGSEEPAVDVHVAGVVEAHRVAGVQHRVPRSCTWTGEAFRPDQFPRVEFHHERVVLVFRGEVVGFVGIRVEVDRTFESPGHVDGGTAQGGRHSVAVSVLVRLPEGHGPSEVPRRVQLQHVRAVEIGTTQVVGAGGIRVEVDLAGDGPGDVDVVQVVQCQPVCIGVRGG